MIRLLLLLALVAYAPALVTVVPGPRPTKNMLFVVDTSGSMSGGGLGKAMGAVEMIAGQPVDAGKFGVVSFSDNPTRWKHNGREWWDLPSQRAVKRATVWLGAHASVGNTKLGPALALALEDKQRDLTIIVVSDGQFGHDTSIMEALKKGQARRVKRKLGKAMVMCYGIGTIPAYVGSSSTLAKLAKAGGGGFYRTDK